MPDPSTPTGTPSAPPPPANPADAPSATSTGTPSAPPLPASPAVAPSAPPPPASPADAPSAASTGTPSAPPPATNPADTGPAPGKPVRAEPVTTNPADAEPVPVPGKPVSAEPVAARPADTGPGAARPGTAPGPPTGSGRAVLIADTALALLAERGMRGLTHRAVDEAAGLPPGSTSNHARTRLALLEAANERLATREARALAVTELPDPVGGPDAVADALAPVLHRYLTGHRELLVCRYELALEATRRPELRHRYDEAGRRFREPLLALVTALGSPDPPRHTLSLIAWSDGMMFACVAGSHHAEVPTLDQLRDGLRELLTGMVGAGPTDDRR